VSRKSTQTKILLASLQLFNAQGVNRTSVNSIADEAGISPGNLTYHFRKKSALVDALLREFQADSRTTFNVPASAGTEIEKFWTMLHGVLEILTAYRFLFRDTESVVAEYPKVRVALRGFVGALAASVNLRLRGLGSAGVLNADSAELAQLSRIVVTITMFEHRVEQLTARAVNTEPDYFGTARAVLAAVMPFASAEARGELSRLSEHYIT
jgi:AcrR family transcriptional regulator